MLKIQYHNYEFYTVRRGGYKQYSKFKTYKDAIRLMHPSRLPLELFPSGREVEFILRHRVERRKK